MIQQDQRFAHNTIQSPQNTIHEENIPLHNFDQINLKFRRYSTMILSNDKTNAPTDSRATDLNIRLIFETAILLTSPLGHSKSPAGVPRLPFQNHGSEIKRRPTIKPFQIKLMAPRDLIDMMTQTASWIRTIFNVNLT